MKIKKWELTKEILLLCLIAMLPGGLFVLKAMFDRMREDESIGSDKAKP